MDARMDTLATVDHIERLDHRIDGIMDQLDKQTVILQRLDQERVFMADKLQLRAA